MIGISEAVGKRILILRTERGKKQHDIAKYLGITPQQVQKYEVGKNAISLQTVIDLCEFFGISMKDFLEGIPVEGNKNLLSW